MTGRAEVVLLRTTRFYCPVVVALFYCSVFVFLVCPLPNVPLCREAFLFDTEKLDPEKLDTEITEMGINIFIGTMQLPLFLRLFACLFFGIGILMLPSFFNRLYQKI